jgi:hypothetical protein
MYDRAKSELCRRPHQKVVELARPLIIAPIADPYQIVFFLCGFYRMEQREIGRLVPSESAAAPASPRIDLAQHLAEGENAIITVERQIGDLARRRDRAVMRVVKEQAEPAAALAPPADGCDEFRCRPFVDDHDIGTLECPIEVGSGAIGLEHHARHEPRCALEHRPAAVAQCVGPAPAILRFMNPHFMPERDEFPHHPAQKMRIAVVPAGTKGVVEQHKFHGWAPSAAACSAGRTALGLTSDS